MTLNEIYNALNEGKKVYWINLAYKVFIENNELYVINLYNDYMTKLQHSEINDCFVGV